MKAAGPFLALIGFALFGATVFSADTPTKPEPPADLQTAIERQTATRAATSAEFSGRLTAVRNWYAGQLDTLQKEATTRGDLDGVLALKSERERLDRPLTPEETKAIPAALALVRGRYDQAVAQLVAMQKASEIASIREYAATLDSLQKRLTQKGDIDGALKVKTERTTISEQLASLELGKPAVPPAAVPASVTPSSMATVTPPAVEPPERPSLPTQKPTGSAAIPGVAGEYAIAQIDAIASTFTVALNGQLRTFRVRPSVDVTINGIKATFAELEPGMKVKVASAEPGLATRLDATGLRSIVRSPTHPALGAKSQPAREVKATIPANSPDAFPVGDVRKGTKLSLQYLGGKWKCDGHLASFSPDDEDPKFSENNRLVLSLPSADGNPGDILAIVPGGTAKKPFVFEADKDYPGIVLRIHDYNGFASNPGKTEYTLKILPPSR